jgi:hypothetical protein
MKDGKPYLSFVISEPQKRDDPLQGDDIPF